MVSSSGYFKNRKFKKQAQQRKQTEKAIVKAFELHKGRYGYRKISHYLNRNKDFSPSFAQVRHALNKRGLRARKAKPFKPVTTQSGKDCFGIERVFKTGQSLVTGVNQVWGSDMTYLRSVGGSFLYLAVFLDFYSRRVVGWDLSHSLSSGVVLRAFYSALRTRSVSQGLIVHSDRGVQ